MHRACKINPSSDKEVKQNTLQKQGIMKQNIEELLNQVNSLVIAWTHTYLLKLTFKATPKSNIWAFLLSSNYIF